MVSSLLYGLVYVNCVKVICNLLRFLRLVVIEKQTKNIILQKQFQIPIEKSQKERGKIDTSNTQIHDLSLQWLRNDTSNTQIHDHSLFWLGTGLVTIPLTQIHDHSLSWHGTGLVEIPLTHKYITTHFTGLVQVWQLYL